MLQILLKKFTKNVTMSISFFYGFAHDNANLLIFKEVREIKMHIEFGIIFE